MVRSVLAALRFGLCLVSCLDPPPNTVQERLFREILDRHSPDKSTGKLCHHLIQSFRVSPLSVTLPLLKSTHNRTRAGPLPVAFIGLAHPGHSLLLTSFTSTPLDTALQSRIRSPIPHKTHPEQVLRTQQCRTQTPTTRLRPMTPRPSRHPRQ